MGLSLRAVVTGALLSIPLGAMPTNLKAQNNVPALQRESISPEREKQIIEARKIIADMRTRGVSQKKIDQEIQRLVYEIVGDEDKSILFRGKPMPLSAAVLLLITGFGMMAINKREREKADSPEANLSSSLD